MAIANKPIQETGSSYINVKVFPQDGSGGSIVEESTAKEPLEIVKDKGETAPVEENGRMPEKWAGPLYLKPDPEVEKESDINEMSSQTLSEEKDQVSPGQDVKGKKKKTRPRKKRSSKERKEANQIPSSVEDGPLPIIKVNAETQTETKMFKEGEDMKPEPEVEKESDIKEMSTQTLKEEKDQVSPEQDVNGKKKKVRPKKKRSSKEKKEANQSPPSDDNTQSRSISFQPPAMFGGIRKFACCLVLVLFFCIKSIQCGIRKYAWRLVLVLIFCIKSKQCMPVDNGPVNTYRFVSESNLEVTTVTITNGKSIMCDILKMPYQEEVPCDRSLLFLVNSTTLIMCSKEKMDSLHLEAGERNPLLAEYLGLFNDTKSAQKSIYPKEDPTPHNETTEIPYMGDATEGMPWWAIALIVIGIIVIIGGPVLLYKFRDRFSCLRRRNTQSPEPEIELEPLNRSKERNGVGGVALKTVGGVAQNGIGGVALNTVGGVALNTVGGVAQNGVGGVAQNGVGGVAQNGVGGVATS